MLMLIHFGLLRPGLLNLEDTKMGMYVVVFVVVPCRLIVRRPTLEAATKKLFHQYAKIWEKF